MVEKYNNTKHRSIGMTPVQASELKIQKKSTLIYIRIYLRKLNQNFLLVIKLELPKRKVYFHKDTRPIGPKNFL